MESNYKNNTGKESHFFLGTESVNPLLTDFYQYSMIYAHWKNNRSKDPAVFDLYFRKCPFNLNFCVFGGVDECFEFLSSFKFTDEQIEYIKTQFPNAEKEFFDYLSKLDMSEVKVYGFNNADYVIANEPLLTLEGPMDKVQLVETTLLNLTNYPTLIASLALKLRMNLSSKFEGMILVEDGSINAQSPNGAYLGVKYSIIGGVDYTTCLLPTKNLDLNLFIKTPMMDRNVDIPFNLDEDFTINGVNLLHLIKARKNSDEIFNKLQNRICRILYPLLITKNNQFTYEIFDNINLDEELTLFNICAFAINSILPDTEVILILNFNNSSSQIENVISSKIIEGERKFKLFVKYDTKMIKEPIPENIIQLIDGIILGTDFLVSSTQPALGMVYKINEVNRRPCIKFSEEKAKQTIPGFKSILRLFDSEGKALADFMCLRDEKDKYLNEKEISAYSFDEFTTTHQLHFSSSQVMNNLLFDGGKIIPEFTNVKDLGHKVKNNFKFFKNQHLKLYISEGIRNIIVEETKKMQEISQE